MDTGTCTAYSLPEMKASPPGCCEEGLALQILEKVIRLERLGKSFTFGSFEIRSSAENKACVKRQKIRNENTRKPG